MKALVSIIACLMLSGCWLSKDNPKPVAPAAALNTAVIEQEAKSAQIRAEVAANVETARKANSTQVDGPAKGTVEGELSLAAKRLDATPDPIELLAGEQRARAMLEGRVDEARKLYDQASIKATEEAKERAKLEANLKTALEDHAKLEAQYQRELASLKAGYEKQIDTARNEVMRDQVKWLNRSGAACAAVAIGALALCLGFGGIAALRVAGPFAAIAAVGSLVCFGLAQIVGQWWFKWAVLSLAVAAIAVVGAWLWRHARQGNLKEEAKSRADRYSAVLKQVIPVLDEAYDRAQGETKAALDSIFSHIGNKMNSDQKAVVHEVRAEIKAKE